MATVTLLSFCKVGFKVLGVNSFLYLSIYFYIGSLESWRHTLSDFSFKTWNYLTPVPCSGNMDFSSSSWMSSLVEEQTISRTVDGNVFTITSSGNNIFINGFPVTVDQWNQVLSGKTVKLSFQGKEATLSLIGSNVMFDGMAISSGSNISTQTTFGSNFNLIGSG